MMIDVGYVTWFSVNLDLGLGWIQTAHSVVQPKTVKTKRNTLIRSLNLINKHVYMYMYIYIISWWYVYIYIYASIWTYKYKCKSEHKSRNRTMNDGNVIHISTKNAIIQMYVDMWIIFVYYVCVLCVHIFLICTHMCNRK